MTSFEVSALGRNLDRAIDWWRAYLAEHLAWLVDWLNLPQNRTTWRRKHAPNIVTIGRGVVAILLLAVLFRFGHNYAVRAICITLLGIDLMFDGVDGMLAEKLDRQTKTGAVLDVVVDHFIILLGISVYEALRDAVAQARGDGGAVQLTAPATAENVLKALGD